MGGPSLSAPAPQCGACECNLRMVQGSWVCDQPGCPQYGAQQAIWPESDSPRGDKRSSDG